jgi:hypothetical protein
MLNCLLICCVCGDAIQAEVNLLVSAGLAVEVQ